MHHQSVAQIFGTKFITVKIVLKKNHSLLKIEHMEKMYTSYQRNIDRKIFYFVKGFSFFPEYPEIPKILDQYAMHHDFVKACKIAGILDRTIMKKLYLEMHPHKEDVKVISMNYRNNPSIISNAKRLLGKLKIASFF